METADTEEVVVEDNLNNSVSKLWQAKATELLTRNSQTISTLLTQLSTMTREEKEKLKTGRTQPHYDLAFGHLRAAICAGWQQGIHGYDLRAGAEIDKIANRRVAALATAGWTEGHRIAAAQLSEIRRRKHENDPAKRPPRNIKGAGPR